MAAVFDQLLGSNQSKTAGTSLVISPASKTATVGKTIFVAFGSDDVGSAFGVTDNLGNTYAQVGSTAQNAGNCKAQLWAAPVTVGGSITSITISWTTNITAKAAVAGEYSNFGTLRLDDQNTNNADHTYVLGDLPTPTSFTFNNGELWIGAAVEEAPNDFSFASTDGGLTGGAVAGSNGTSGGGAASNIAAALVHSLNTATGSGGRLSVAMGSIADNAGCGAIYNAAAADIPPGLGPVVQEQAHMSAFGAGALLRF